MVDQCMHQGFELTYCLKQSWMHRRGPKMVSFIVVGKIIGWFVYKYFMCCNTSLASTSQWLSRMFHKDINVSLWPTF